MLLPGYTTCMQHRIPWELAVHIHTCTQGGTGHGITFFGERFDTVNYVGVCGKNDRDAENEPGYQAVASLCRDPEAGYDTLSYGIRR